MSKTLKIICYVPVLLLLAAAAFPQARRNKKPVVKTTTVTPRASTPAPTPEPTIEKVEPKINKRPGGDAAGAAKASKTGAATPVFFYEFKRPGFTYGHILIEHDEAGRGKISFLKDGFDEMFTDPIELSAVTVSNVNEALAALNFFDSTEEYQYAGHDFSNMGNMSLRVKRTGRERTVKYNWTENKNAKVLMDEYRRIGNEYTWRFEMTLASENQPLLAPGLMDTMDSYLKRNEISDPPHLVPYLTLLSTDERIPLMARNHAGILIKQIEKGKK